MASDSQLVAVDQLQDHLNDLPEDELTKLETDVQTFLRYWSCGTKQHSAEYISHIFGIVSKTSSDMKLWSSSAGFSDLSVSLQIKLNGLTLPDQRGLQMVGLGLFPNLSLVNHDCWPNCTATLNHGKYVIFLLFRVKKPVDIINFVQICGERKLEMKILTFH